MSASLAAEFLLRRPTLQLDVKLSLNAPWSCLFGASGSGKSTILRTIAGFEQPEAGRITLDGQVLSDVQQGLHMPPHQRPVRLAAQRSWLFPGTVRQNVLYGVERDHRERADALLALMDLHTLSRTRASALSGGEQQRVAIARAIAAALYGPQPARLLMLDEPFNGMDAARRDHLATRLRDWLAAADLPVLSVTHDVAEVYMLGAEVMRLEGGRIVAQGTPAEVLVAERGRLLNTLTKL